MKGLTEAKRKATGEHGRPLHLYLLPGLAVALITVLVLAVLAQQVLSRGARDSAERTMQRSARLVSSALSQEVRARIDRLSFLASEPGLAAWVARGMQPEDREAEVARLSTWLPGVLEVRLLPAGWQRLDPTDQGLRAPLGFAGIEMLRRVVATGKPALAEVHQADIGKPYIALAVPLWRGKQPVGALMAAYPPDDMRRLLETFAPLPGELRLEQVAADGHYVMSQIGSSDVGDADRQTLAVPGTIWQLDYRANPQIAFGIDLVTFLGFALLGMLPLVLVFWLQVRTLARNLDNDLEGVAEQVQAYLGGRSPNPAEAPGLRPVARLQARLNKLLREARNGTPATTAQASSAPAPAPVDVPRAVFRAYDIRGNADQLLSDDFARRLGAALASRLGDTTGEVAVGRDVRHASERLQRALMQGLRQGGRSVIDLGLAPTPLVYYGQQALGASAAVVVTGSHNPPEDNGFKIVVGDKVLSGDALADLRTVMAQALPPAADPGAGRSQDVSGDYLARVSGDIHLARPLKIVIDAGNGVAGPLARQLFEALGCEVFELFCEPDGDFPHHHPDPSQPDNLGALTLEVLAREADLGLAFDGDGDRLGVVDSAGEVIWPDRVLMLLARDLLIRHPGSDILFDVKCSRHLSRFVLTQGGRPLMNASGHARMRARMRDSGALLGGEFSGHFFIAERWFGFDDALYAGARVLEIIAADERLSAEQFAELPASPATPEYHLVLPEGANQTLMEKLREQADFGDAELVTVDGLRVEFADGWGLVRPSNTTPTLVFRFEADNEAALTRIKGRLRDWLSRVVPDLKAPF